MPDDMVLTLIGEPKAEWAVYLMAGEARSRAVYSAMQTKDVALVCAGGDWNWNRDLTPWPAPRCVKGGEAFGGGARLFLSRIGPQIDAFEASAGMNTKRRALAGYSLAGLFSLYALYMSEQFDAAAVVSGSLWYKDFLSFMRTNQVRSANPRVYFSVGDLEKHTRNPWFSTIEDRMREAADLLQAHGAETTFVLEVGNHFADENMRVARGIDWIVEGARE